MEGFERFRRYRATRARRKLFSSLSLHPSDLVLPLFVTQSAELAGETDFLKIQRYGLQQLRTYLEPLKERQLQTVLLFPVLEHDLKDPRGDVALTEANPLYAALRLLKKEYPNLNLICDVALDPYTTHGHDGCLHASGYVENDPTVEQLVKLSMQLAEAGADGLAPSDMMDGRILAIRNALDQNGKTDVFLVSYSAKFASAFYGPFRQVVNAPSRSLDKKQYQLAPGSRFEALLESAADDREGADVLLIKPASHYLDLLPQAAQLTAKPLGVYQVSGEYEMLQLGAQAELWDFETALWESLLCFKRAGASLIVSYGTAHCLLNWEKQETVL